MPSFLSLGSDDQTALMGCACAFVASLVIMYLSYFVGPQARQAARRRQASPLNQPQPLRSREDRAA